MRRDGGLQVICRRSDLAPGQLATPAASPIQDGRLLPAEPFAFAGREAITDLLFPVAAEGAEWFVSGFAEVATYRREAGRAGLRHVATRPSPPAAAWLRPAAPGVDAGDGWIFLARDEEPRDDGLVRWRFVRIGREFAIDGMSAPFSFGGLERARAGGLTLNGDRLVIAFATGEGSLFAGSLPLRDAVALLEPLAPPGADPGERHPVPGASMLRPRSASLSDAPAPGRLADQASTTRLVAAATDVGALWTYADDREIGMWLRDRGTWGEGESRFMRDLVRPGMMVLDVGANLGYCSVLLSQLVGAGGSVLAIEAEPGNASLLRANLALNGAGNVEALAVAAHRERTTVSMALFDPGNLGGFQFTHGAGVAVPAWPLDDLLDPDVPVGFIKVDVEGADHLAVAGLSRTIRRWRPAVLVEFAPHHIATVGETPGEALAVYRSLDMRIMLLGESAQRLIRYGGVDANLLLDAGLVVQPWMEEEIIAAATRVGTLNFALWPAGPSGEARP
ncbi:MAG: FkbM family methyltransferase [Chloroflexota bacterium]